MLEGYKTYIGIAITILGSVGLGYLVTPSQLGDLVDSILKIAGIVISVYGNYKAHQTITTLKSSSTN